MQQSQLSSDLSTQRLSMDVQLERDYLHRLDSFETRLSEHLLHSSTLSQLADEWLLFVDELQPIIGADSFSVSTLSTISTLSQKVSGILQDYSDVEHVENELLVGQGGCNEPRLFCLGASHAYLRNSRYRAYIEPSYRWLLENLHNPYPSSNIRDQISRSSGCSRKDVDNWFISVRKRIGWNDLRKRAFNNKLEKMIDAATRFFADADIVQSVDTELEFDFIAVKNRAKDLYRDLRLHEGKSIKQLETGGTKRLQSPQPKSMHLASADHRRPVHEDPSRGRRNEPSLPHQSLNPRKRQSSLEVSEVSDTERPAKRARQHPSPLLPSIDQVTSPKGSTLSSFLDLPSASLDSADRIDELGGETSLPWDGNGSWISFEMDLPGLPHSDVSSNGSFDCSVFENWFQSSSCSPHLLPNNSGDISSSVNVGIGHILHQFNGPEWDLSLGDGQIEPIPPVTGKCTTGIDGLENSETIRHDLHMLPGVNKSMTTSQLFADLDTLPEVAFDTHLDRLSSSTSVLEPEIIQGLDNISQESRHLTERTHFPSAKTASSAFISTKDEKMKQLMEMKEAMIRLEHEIASFG